MKNNIFWIKNDLRFEDNTAFIKAVEDSYDENSSLILVFHIDSEKIKLGTYSNDYFFSALNVFYKKLRNMGADLLFLYGDTKSAFDELFKTNKNINKLYFNISERGCGLKRDRIVIKLIEEYGLSASCFLDNHLHKADEILTKKGSPYKVFTSYYKKWLSLSKKDVLNFDFNKFKKLINNNFSNIYKTDYDRVLKSRKNNFENHCGEEKAIQVLCDFIEYDLENYDKNRDDVFIDANSKISEYLSTGQISIRQVYQAISSEGYSVSSETYIKQLAWRDFYNMVYHYNPEQKNREIIEKYRFIKWNKDKYAFYIWKYGLTGYPIVDAAMRDLLKTGRMHNRLRMIVASFLIKDLLVDWRVGERYFEEMLIDYDSASNIGSWQWVASTGTDACPYFRIFNPTTQSKRFDKNALYIKSVLKELNDIDKKYIHEPHKSMKDDLDYPKQIVNHKEQRTKILNMYKSLEVYDYSTDMKGEFIKRYTLLKFSELKEASKKDLIEFHANNKYLYFTYNMEIKNKLGEIVSHDIDYKEMYSEYRAELIKLFKCTPTVKKTVNAYQHIYGYFKKLLNVQELAEYNRIMEVFIENDDLDDCSLKLLFNKLANKYGVDYIRRQTVIEMY